jgi:hypothetical protein
MTVRGAPTSSRRAPISLLALVALSALAACDSAVPVDGHCGAYTSTPGIARITSVETPPSDQFNCSRDPVRVLFDFIPTEPGSTKGATGAQLTVAGGANPPRAWVTASGLAVGTEHPAVRADQPVGPCSPVVYTLTDVDLNAGASACFSAM